MSIKIVRSWNGMAHIDQDNTGLVPRQIIIAIWKRLGIVQASTNDKWVPEQHIKPGQSYEFTVGDFEITVHRKQSSTIHMNEARYQRQERQP